jgi:hypothetical protein
VESKSKEKLTEQIPVQKVVSFDLDQYVTAFLPENVLISGGRDVQRRSATSMLIFSSLRSRVRRPEF